MTDVWTSVGVVAGIAAVAATGWLALDPIVALAVAAQILRTGARLVRRSFRGLLDPSLVAGEQETVRRVLARLAGGEVQFHAIRTRQAGARRFVSVHVLVPGDWSVQRGHALCERLEIAVAAEIPNATVFTHLEAVEDPASFEDQGLDRPRGDQPART
jgi:cation diffusion facilitator family transporter